MKSSRLVRLLAVPALVVPVVAGSLAFSPSAFAAPAVCTALSGNASGSPAPTLTGCNDPANTGGTGSFTGLTSPTLVTWATGGTDTITFKFKLLTGRKNKCPAGDSEAQLTGKISGHSGLGSSVSGKVKAFVCVDGSGNLSLQGTTTFKL